MPTSEDHPDEASPCSPGPLWAYSYVGVGVVVLGPVIQLVSFDIQARPQRLNQGDLLQLGSPDPHGIRRHACEALRRSSDQPWRFAIDASKNYIAVISLVNRPL